MMSPMSSEAVEREVALRNSVLLHVDLQALAVLKKMREAGLAHAPQGLDAAADAHGHGRGQLLGGLRAVVGEDLRDAVREVEAAAVGAEAESLNFTNPIEALLE